MIAFIGSVFSPYYAWCGRRDPLNHCALNVALYGDRGGRWAMTERGRESIVREPRTLRIGPSSLRWRGNALEIAVDEVCAPLPRRICGTIRITPLCLTERSFALDAGDRHLWQPIAPKAQIEVLLTHPDLSWSGMGYLDSNFGGEPLERGFQHWTWTRLHRRDDTIVLYAAKRRDGTEALLALCVDQDGQLRSVTPPSLHPLPATRWRLARQVHADMAPKLRVRKTLEDTPFYARSLIEADIFGERAEGFHEILSLDRFASPIVRAMLPFRMPRRVF